MPGKRQKLEDASNAGQPGPGSSHVQSAVGGPLPGERDARAEASTSQPAGAPAVKGTFRFWHEERRFKGPGEKCIVQRAMFESGGVRTGGYPKSAPIPGPLGWQRPTDWDFLWAPARLALKAIPHLKPGQLVSACPGLMAITKKRRLPATLKDSLGEVLAWDIVPHSFSLPEDLSQLAAHVAATTGSAVPAPSPAPPADAEPGPSGSASGDAGAGPGSEAAAAGGSDGGAQPGSGSGQGGPGQELWILKTAQHLGKGLKLVPLEAAAVEAARPRRRASQKPYVLAQRYVDRPLLLQGRKFGLRVWVAVTGFNPLRAYLHTNGLVLFSTHGYDSASWRTEAGDVALGHITNYAQNMGGTVWSLTQLEEHMGSEAYGRMWRAVQRNSALTIAACLKHIKSDHDTLRVPSGMTCEVVGLDFLVDEDLHPWLLEVNGTPSLQVEHEDPAVEGLIHEQKYSMVKDLMSLLGLRERFKPRYAALRAAAKAKSQAVAAAAVAAAATNGGGGSAALAAAMAGAAAAAKPSTAAITKRLREQMLPATDQGVFAKVAEELRNRGGFEPLMPLMPLEPQPGLTVPWDARDHELRRLMREHGSALTGGEGASSSGGEGGAVAGADGDGEGEGALPEEPAGTRRRGAKAGAAARRAQEEDGEASDDGDSSASDEDED